MTDDHGQTPMTDDEIEAASLGAAQQVNGQVALREYDPHWPAVYEREAALIGARLDERPPGGGGRHRLEHVGSTSVPGLPAKPVIDMLLFRDRLRTHPRDRELYAETKRALARQEWKYLQNYADAKTEVVERILKRARPNRAS
ncbi:GrpB family protein [Streptomyces niveus]|uniref:GrpB family protein n=1 Tax=Streptomyces niveus TaxID=193462 RepID=UPI0038381D22